MTHCLDNPSPAAATASILRDDTVSLTVLPFPSLSPRSVNLISDPDSQFPLPRELSSRNCSKETPSLLPKTSIIHRARRSKVTRARVLGVSIAPYAYSLRELRRAEKMRRFVWKVPSSVCPGMQNFLRGGRNMRFTVPLCDMYYCSRSVSYNVLYSQDNYEIFPCNFFYAAATLINVSQHK